MQTYRDAIREEYPQVRAYPDDDDEWGNEARASFQQGDIAAAIAKYKMVTLAQPQHHEGFEGLALCYERQGKIAEARYFMGEALQRARRFLDDQSLDPIVMDELEETYARLDPSVYASMSTKDVVQVQRRSFRWPDPALLREVLRRGAESVDPLTKIFGDDLIGNWASDFAAQMLASLYVNGVTEAVDAVPMLALFFETSSEDWLKFLVDYMSVFGEHTVNELLPLLQDKSLDWYQQGMVAHGSIAAAWPSPTLRARVADGLRELLAQYVEKKRADTVDPNVAGIISNLAELHDEPSRPLVEQAFALKLPDEGFINKDDYEEKMQQETPAPNAFDKDWLDKYERQYVSAVYDPVEDEYLDDEDGSDDAFDDDADNKSSTNLAELRAAIERLMPKRPMQDNWPQLEISRTPIEPMQPIRAQAKPGRNDPCWCGSGKKYKHCHLREDEAK